MRRLAISLLLALAVPAYCTITSAPVDLGSAGLTVTVGLLHWVDTAPDTWSSASTAGITVNDLGGGLYSVSGLPLATGTERYAVSLTAGGVGLASYSYGAQPGVRLVWQEEIVPAAHPLVFRRGDTYGSVALVVKRGLPAGACAATATMSAANASTNAVLFTDQAASITGCELDNTTNSYGATITMDLGSGGYLATAGKYTGLAKLCYSPGVCQSLPGGGQLTWEVVKRPGE